MKVLTTRFFITTCFVSLTILGACGQQTPSQHESGIAATGDQDTPAGDQVADQAMVFKSSLEGGFYYLRTSEGTVYVPVGMPAELQNEGVFIDFTATKLTDTYSPIMAGQLVHIDTFSYPTE